MLAVGLVGYALVQGVRSLSDFAAEIDLTTDADGDRRGDGDGDAPSTSPPDDVEVEVPDLEGLDGVDAAMGQVLVAIDRAERTMIATQSGFAEALAGPEGDAEAALDDLADAAGDGQRTLQELRRDLAAPVDDDEVRTIRDRYLAHLDAWVRYLVAVEDDPTLLAGGAEQEAFLLAIDTTGDAFAGSVRDGLPDGLDEELQRFAEQLIDRGFPERAPSDGDTV